MLLDSRTAAWGLSGLLGLVAAAACADEPHQQRQGYGKGLYVPATWMEARTIRGHQVHVVHEKVVCADCHDMSADRMGPVKPSACARCHESQARIEHDLASAHQAFGEGSPADCTTCHAFKPLASGGEPPGPWECLRCHAEAQGDSAAVVVHNKGGQCQSCHQPHAVKSVQPSQCQECHGAIQTEHAAEGKTAGQVCTTCHTDQHAPAEAAREGCAECHATQPPIVGPAALFPEGHTACIGCHRPHTFEKAQAVACRECHEDVRVLATPRVKQHAECTSCHDPHAAQQDASGACLKCHAEAKTDHPRAGQTDACTTCHDPHPPHAQAPIVRSCSGCHQAAASDHGFHAASTECTDCHKPHHFGLKDQPLATCNDCHAAQVTRAGHEGGHENCAGCHTGLPHRPVGNLAECASCHGAERAAVTAGHASCTNCHEPHSGDQQQACATCHREVHQTAPAGHRTCNQCHTPHSGSVARECQSCHQAQAATPHGTQVKGGCQTCHRAHGPEGVAKPPACASCHTPKTLPALHQEPRHQDCTRCHAGHENTVAVPRATCLSCHQDRRQHFPEAAQCTGCHLFRAADAPKP